MSVIKFGNTLPVLHLLEKRERSGIDRFLKEHIKNIRNDIKKST